MAKHFLQRTFIMRLPSLSHKLSGTYVLMRFGILKIRRNSKVGTCNECVESKETKYARIDECLRCGSNNLLKGIKKNPQKVCSQVAAAHCRSGSNSRLPTFQVAYKSGGRNERNMPSMQAHQSNVEKIEIK